jgi:RHS repeat-associated protein
VPTVSYTSSITVANHTIVPLSTIGTIKLSSSAAVDFYVIVTGWYQAATSTWTYGYNGDGLRTSKTDPTGAATTFSWGKNTGLPLLTSETTGSSTTYYLYGAGDQAVEQINPDGSVEFFHHDQIGSIRLITDSGSTVHKLATATYDAYGKTTGITGTLSHLGYAGQYTDPETGVQYLRARYFDPGTGQFLGRDPLAQLTRDPFGYAGRMPLTASDPTGADMWGIPTPNDLIDAGGDAIQRGEDLVIAVKNAPITETTVAINEATGGDCSWDKHLTVACEGGALSDAWGQVYTTGNTINVPTSQVDFWHSFHDDLVEHESNHAMQWAMVPDLPLFYWLANGKGPCNNVFEQWAGLAKGQYHCASGSAAGRLDGSC